MTSYMSDLTRRMKGALTPLSQREARRAVEAAVAHLAVQGDEGTGERFSVLGAELRIVKPPKQGGVPRRLVRVLIADYGNKRNLDVLVDGSGTIVEAVNYRGFQPAFHPDEIREARKIAERDERVTALTTKRRLFVTAYVPEKTPRGSSRHIGLRYTLVEKGRGVGLLASVSVDLCSQQITAIEGDESARRQRGR